MQIWVDADACPNAIKEILYRVAMKRKVPVTLVANAGLQTPASNYIKAIQVASGFDVADDYIAEYVESGDIVITGDIPLASEVINKDAFVISPRGEKLGKNNIQQRLTMRNFMEEMRTIGEARGGPKPMSKTDRQAFANALDQLLAKYLRA